MDLASGFERLRLITSRINRGDSEEQKALRREHIRVCEELMAILQDRFAFLKWVSEKAKADLQQLNM
jgi:hypothetical protein